VVDPGPDDPGHLENVLRAADRVSAVVLTHWHLDHSEGVAPLVERTGCPVYAADPHYATVYLRDGAVLTAPGLTATARATPGHTADSMSLVIEGEAGCHLLTGDMVLGRGTTVIMHPDGDLRAYFRSLDRYEAIVQHHRVQHILPGHGPVVDQPAEWLAWYREHRLERLAQVRAALAAGDQTADEVVARVYADVDRSVWPAARLSVLAQLAYLREEER
jgi:glyoxylase-like metal-dependent hydrolase (beta-lactamase superfamily II)